MSADHTPRDAESPVRNVPDQEARFVRKGETEQDKLKTALAALKDERAKRRRAVKAIDVEARARRAAEAALRDALAVVEELNAERDGLAEEIEAERAERVRLEAELQAANLQAAGLQERLYAMWARVSPAKDERPRPASVMERLRRNRQG